MSTGLELGLYTLGEHVVNPHTKQLITPQERIKNIIEMAQLAEQAGFDIFQVGESHQRNFISQAHLIILSAIAQSTKTIRLASGATIIGAADPVRVYEAASTIDLLSDGRMELVCGRSARTGLYETLGFELADYEALFNEKFELLKLINQREIVNWTGEHRAPLNNVPVLPRALHKQGLPIWRAVGGSLESAKQAGQAGDPIYVSHFSGDLKHYQLLIDQYRRSLNHEGFEPSQYPLAVASYLFVRPDTSQAIDDYYPFVNEGSITVNEQRIERNQFEKAKNLDSVINVGSPELVVEKLIKQYEELGMTRYIGQIDFGGMPFEEVKRTITLLGEKVIPEVKKYTTK